MKVVNPAEEFQTLSTETDEQGIRHTKLQQTFNGIKLYEAELFLHSGTEKVNALNGRVFPSPQKTNTRPAINKSSAIEKGLQELSKTYILQKQQTPSSLINLGKDEAELIIYHQKGESVLAY